MKEIQLTQGQVALVDDEDYERINAHKWRAQWDECCKTFYAVRQSPFVNGKRHVIRMHREVMGATGDEQVDHINNNGLDNQRKHLRLCVRRQNCANRRKRSDNTSGFKGVSRKKTTDKWQAHAMIDGKQRHLGYFTTALDAALAYDRRAVESFGEFALTNQKLGLLPDNK